MTHLALTRTGDAAVLTIQRPEVLNALSFDLLRDIGAAIDEVAQGDARVLIVTGSGAKAFCAGADIAELRERPLMAQKRGAEFGQQAFARLDRLAIPSIAAINGYSFGGGLELAMACTFRIAAPGAKLGLPEVKLGLIPGYGGTQRLPRLIGEARALELIMTGRTIGAEEAERWGLVNRIAEGDVVEAALAFAGEFTGYGLPTLEFARSAVRRAGACGLDEGLRCEAELSTLAYQTEDSIEGMAAFAEKRKAVFKDA